MEIAFYVAGAIAVLATLRMITCAHPVHALLYLIVSLLAVAMVFFALGAPFAGAMEVIVYAGAIMVLFVFVVMMLNLGEHTIAQERQWLSPGIWAGPCLLSLALAGVLFHAIFTAGAHPAGAVTVDARAIGIALYGPNLLLVELASMLLLGAMVAAYHIGRNEKAVH